MSNLPLSIAGRQKQSVIDTLGDFSPVIETTSVPSKGKGTFVFLKLVSDNAVAGFSSLGERGKRAEDVGREAEIGRASCRERV